MGEQMDNGFVQLPLLEYNRLKDLESKKEETQKEIEKEWSRSHVLGIKRGASIWKTFINFDDDYWQATLRDGKMPQSEIDELKPSLENMKKLIRNSKYFAGWTRGLFKRSWFGFYRKEKTSE